MAGLDLPYGAPDPAAGLEPYQEAIDQAVMGNTQIDAELGALAAPPAASQRIMLNPATKELFVNGMQFGVDDARSALASEEWAAAPDQGKQAPAGFSPIAPQDYELYLQNIKDPSLARLATKNFGIGVDNMQLLGGAALQFAGAEGVGGAIVEQQIEDIAKSEPYQRAFTDIESAEGFGDWMIANAAQLAPNMIEAIVVAGLGAATGGAGFAGAGAVRAGAELAKFAGKKNAREVAKKLIAKQAAGKTLRTAEQQVIKRLGQAGGAVIASAANNYGIGIGDIYNEMQETGTSNRLLAALSAVPYAAAELAPEILGASVLLKGLGKGSKGGRLKRGAKGFGAGAGIEGSTETAQEIINLAATGQLDMNDPEVQNRLINAFAAGAGVGGPLGGIAKAAGKTRVDIEAPDASLNPAANPAFTGEGEQVEMFLEEDLGAAAPILDEGQVQGEMFPDVRPAEAPVVELEQLEIPFEVEPQLPRTDPEAVQKFAETNAAYAEQYPQAPSADVLLEAEQEMRQDDQFTEMETAQAETDAKAQKVALGRLERERSRSLKKTDPANKIIDPKLKITYPMGVDESGEAIMFTGSAASALSAMNKRVDVFTRMKNCLGA